MLFVALPIGALLIGGGCSKPESPPPLRSSVTFPSLAEGWARVDGASLALRASAATGDLKVAARQVHELANLAAALVPLSAGQVVGPEGQVEYAARDLARLAEEAAAAAGRGDRNGVVETGIKARRTLRYLHGLYRPGVLPTMMPE